MVPPNEENGLSFDDIANEAVEEVDGSETAGENSEENTSTPDDAAPGEQDTDASKASTDEEDDEQFLEQNKGSKSIPYSAFQKKYQKWKSRHAEADKKARELEARIAQLSSGQANSPQDLARLKRYEEIFGKYIEASKTAPWLEDVLLKLGQGSEPDWNQVNQALVAWNQARPGSDPRLAREVETIKAQLEEQRQAERVSYWERHRANEDEAIRKELGEEVNDKFLEMVDKIAIGQAAGLSDDAPASAFPNRVEIAKQLAGYARSNVEKALAKQIPANGKKAGANLNNGRGPAAQAKTKIPVPGTQEFMDAMQDDAFLAHLTGE